MRIAYIIPIITFVALTSTSCCSINKNRVKTTRSSPQSIGQMSNGSIEARENLEHFPEAGKGFDRFVIFPEPKESEDSERSFRIEIIPGKTIMADCNRHSLTGNMIEKDLEGWGYTYYEFNSDGQMISTKMACPDVALTEKFIAGEAKMVRYNSKLPVVVYVPKGFEVKFRIWQADELHPARLQ